MQKESLIVYISYAQQDEDLLKKLETHLVQLVRLGLISPWHHGLLIAGDQRADKTKNHLANADLVLLLLSPAFLSSEELWADDLEPALARHESGDARVVPLILRPCGWKSTPLGELEPLPPNGKAVVSWKNADKAFAEVTKGLHSVVNFIIDRRQRRAPESTANRHRITPGRLRDLPVSAEKLTLTDREIVPMELVENPYYDLRAKVVPKHLEDAIMIDTIHAGDYIPIEVRDNFQANYETQSRIDRDFLDHGGAHELLEHNYERLKSWGANHLAAALAQSLNIPGSYRINVPAVLVDFASFADAGYGKPSPQRTSAINYPFSDFLSHGMKRKVLTELYDKISTCMDTTLENTSLRISIRTYDERSRGINVDQGDAPGPDINLVFLERKHLAKHLVDGHPFDPLFPRELAESVKARKLADRISVTLCGSYGVTRNFFPVPLSVQEIRSKVWYFFSFLRDAYAPEAARYDTSDKKEAHELVWDMLLDTNLRSADANIVRSYIHNLRLTPRIIFSGLRNRGDLLEHMENRLKRAREAYDRIREFVVRDRKKLVLEYGRSARRPSSLAIEVRRDLLWNEGSEGPDGIKLNGLAELAEKLTMAIIHYLNNEGQSDFAPGPPTGVESA